MKKKISIFILALFVSLTGYNIGAKTVIEPDGVIEEEIVQTPEEVEMQKQFEKEIQNIEKRNSLMRASASWHILSRVPYVKQANYYYCGPATTLQTQKYYNSNTGSTQNSLAKSLGTTTNGTAYSNIKKVLNSRSYIKNKYYFYKVNGQTKLAVSNYIGNTLVRAKPVVLNIAIKSSNTASKKAIGYTTAGHFLNVNGAYGSSSHYGLSNVTHLKFKDPNNYRGTVANSKGEVQVTSGIAKTVIDNQPSSTKNVLV